MRIYKIGRIGTADIEIVEAPSPLEGCQQLGWYPADCQVCDITDEIVWLKSEDNIPTITCKSYLVMDNNNKKEDN
jgi:hypothetical protein